MRLRWISILLLVAGAAMAQSAERQCDTATPRLRLPFGEKRQVIQGNDGGFSHGGRYRYAWDFAMPVGTPVVAAAAGTVVEVIDRFDGGGADRAFEEKANLVVIDHGKGRLSVYQHLKRGGALVKEGQRVAKGEVLGRSGNTGWTTRPHLHFEVIDVRNRSQPVCFADVEQGVPVEGRSYGAGAAERVGGTEVAPLSLLPRDVFADNGVLLSGDVPARWIGNDSPVRITGKVTRTTRRVAAFFLPRGSGQAARWSYGKVGSDGSFTVDVDFAGLEGPWNFAMAVTDESGRFRSEFSVPVALHRGRR